MRYFRPAPHEVIHAYIHTLCPPGVCPAPARVRSSLDGGCSFIGVAACQIKEVVTNAAGRVVQHFSWAKLRDRDVTKWVYFSEQGKAVLVLSSYQQGKDRLEIRALPSRRKRSAV